MSEDMKQDIQVGDVWANNDVEFNIVMLFSRRVAYWFIDSDGKLGGCDSLIPIFTKQNRLVKRDGKPVREFEEGAFYPVKFGEPARDVARFMGGRFYATFHYNTGGPDMSYEESELSYIGPRIEVAWPAVIPDPNGKDIHTSMGDNLSKEINRDERLQRK